MAFLSINVCNVLYIRLNGRCIYGTYPVHYTMYTVHRTLNIIPCTVYVLNMCNKSSNRAHSSTTNYGKHLYYCQHYNIEEH